MKHTVFLHIGIPKTGTSTIQNFLHQNRDELKKYGFLYPQTASTALNIKGSAHYLLSAALGFPNAHKKVDINGKELINISKALKKEIKECSAKQIIFSSENFYLPCDIEPIKLFFSDYDVRIIIYLRRHDTWWQSAYSQTIKMVSNPPWGRNIEAYIDFSKKRSGIRSYRTLVDEWAKVFGEKNIIVRPYENQQNNPDIVTDFLKAIDFQSEYSFDKNINIESKNISLSYSKLSLIDIYQRANIEPEIRAKLIKNTLEKPYDNEQTSYSLVSPKLQLQLIEENANDYEYIAKKYLQRENGKLFFSPLPNPDAPWSLPKHPTFVEVVERTIQGLK